jgi:hypothetical protein
VAARESVCVCRRRTRGVRASARACCGNATRASHAAPLCCAASWSAVRQPCGTAASCCGRAPAAGTAQQQLPRAHTHPQWCLKQSTASSGSAGWAPASCRLAISASAADSGTCGATWPSSARENCSRKSWRRANGKAPGGGDPR